MAASPPAPHRPSPPPLHRPSPPPPHGTSQAGAARSLLHSGSRFRGMLKCKGEAYEAELRLQHVRLEQNFLNGTLTVTRPQGDADVIFFTAEIISAQHPFLTRKWEADEEVDRKHWGKFKSFYHIMKSFNDDGFDYAKHNEHGEFVYMRWKERHVVPAQGARPAKYGSVDGFYYVEFARRDATISGFYYVRGASEPNNQSLNLKHVPDPCVQVCEVR